MATSRLAAHLPSLFGPSRRAAWRLSLVRRGLAAGALLLALHLAVGAARPPSASPGPRSVSGPAVTLSLAAPAGHLDPGDTVGVYLPGRARPVVTGATILAASTSAGAAPTVRVAVPADHLGELVQEMTPETGGRSGFVVVREG
ncbi:hypothetical protein O9K63_14625 [Janibacter cremeus]|uniref:hypothetical protein n=1 Tax=Janibacter cremeus TaxID=1285192 RepID=UPI0023F8C8C3|nr:hypothetical protein [Janibacter cremeus]WEV77808.1 hypothetical protein O9K63_14625 [Janibacter cremeus]